MSNETEPFLEQALKTIGGLSTAAQALGAPIGWQPIATAPRDGTHVLLFTTDNGMVEAWFAPGEWHTHHEYGPEYEGAVWVCGDDAFQIEVEESPEGFHDGTATHWQPLPEPPRAAV